MKNTKLALKAWNKDVFGNVQHRIKQIKQEIQKLQEMPQHQQVLEEEHMAQKTLDTLLKREELLWRDKSKVRWIDEGDANTRFFHVSTLIHRRYNAISYIQNCDNEWIRSRQGIGMAFQRFFVDLFTSAEPQFPDNLQNLID